MIVDEVPALRQHARLMIQKVLGDELTTVIEADNSESALSLFDQHQPQFVVLDTVNPGISSLKIAHHIWTKAPATRILFWVNQHREFHMRELKRMLPSTAVDGYILQTAEDDKLCRAIESLVRFSNPYTDPNLRTVATTLNCNEAHLTELEQETLGDLLLGLTDKAIARKRNLTVRGVQNRLASLATKLLGRDRSQIESGIEFYNLRVRMIFEALKRGVYTVEDIPELEKNLYCWMETAGPTAQLYSLSR
jgi:DNA-binding NarL/FixJ family response regulator